jgi:hypothetical protein
MGNQLNDGTVEEGREDPALQELGFEMVWYARVLLYNKTLDLALSLNFLLPRHDVKHS